MANTNTQNTNTQRKPSKITFVGYEKKTGSFTNKDTGELLEYDNTMIYLTAEGEDNVKGLKVMDFKAKTANFKIFDLNDNEVPIDEALGRRIIPTANINASEDKEGKIKNELNTLIVR